MHSSQKATRQNSVIYVNPAKTSTATISPKATVTSTTSHNNGPCSTNGPNKGKISLVPTNLLLGHQQQQQQQAPQLQQPQQNKNFFMPASMSATTITTSVGQSSMAGDHGTMPMKVLLVNTMPKQHPQSMTTSSSTAHHHNPNKAEIIPLPMDHNSRLPSTVNQLPLHKHPNRVEEARINHEQRRPRRTTKRIRPQIQTLAIPGLRTLLGNLIQTQKETNAINRERLQLEKRVVDEFMGLLPILKGIAGQFLASVNHQQPTSTLHCNGHVAEEGEEEEEVMAEEDESDT